MPSLSDMIGGSTAPVSAAPAPVPTDLKSIEDTSSMRDGIFDRVKSAAEKRFPVENDRYRIELTNVGYKNNKPFTKAAQKDALLKQQSLTWRLHGDWRMVDKSSGQTVDEKKGEVVAHVPYMTERGTFIRDGNEYTLSSQSRLRPGTYSRRKKNGEFETHFNILEGGRSFHLVMDPATAEFTMQVGGSKMRLAPVLKSLGVTNEQLHQAWGNEIFNKNNIDDDSAKRAMKQFYRGDDPAVKLHDVMGAMKLDPEITHQTLGAKYDNVNGASLLHATQKLLGISRGAAQEDDRDALHYQKLMFPEDLISERIEKDWDKRVTGKTLWNSSRKGKLAVYPGHLTPQIDAVFTKSGLASPIEEVNPLEVIDQRYRVMRTGEGGISESGVPDECFDSYTEVFTSSGWVPWSIVGPSTQFACMSDGKLVFASAHKLVRKPFKGMMYGIKTRLLDLLVTPTHRLFVQKYRGSNGLMRCGQADWEFELAQDAYRSPRMFMISHEAADGQVTSSAFTLPFISGQRKAYSFDLDDWAEFLGWYVSEGSIDSWALANRSKYHLTISQLKPYNVERIAALLTRMAVPHSKQGKNFVFVSKQIGVYLANLGIGAKNKALPEEVFTWPVSARTRLLEGLMLGDGHSYENGHRVYVSTSEQLIEQVIRLATTLGYASRRCLSEDKNQAACKRRAQLRNGSTAQWNVLHRCSILTSHTTGISSERQYDRCYYREHYDGFVYCAQVPGELLLVRRNGSVPVWTGNSRAVQPSHFGMIDPLRSPESLKIGIDSRFTVNALRGKDGIYSQLRGLDGKLVPVPVKTVVNSVVAFPGELSRGGQKVRAMVRGKMEYVDRKEVNYEMAHPSHMFTIGTNLVPMISGTSGQRVSMGSRFISQALAMKEPEAPLVQSLSDDGKASFEELYGTKAAAAVRSHVSGRVSKVTKDYIHVDTPNGPEKFELYNNFSYNRKSALHNTPVVKPGDHIAPGDLLARSNFTDEKGVLGIGKNLRVAFMPWKGLNYEDAYVISRSAANKLTSEHLYPIKVDHDTHTQRGTKEYLSLFPTQFNQDQVKRLDDNGVIRVGQTVKKGDPLVLAVRERPQTDIHRGHKPGWGDASEVWDHESDGVITDVEHDKHGVRVHVKTYKPMQEADKIAVRHGGKGVVSRIIPDEQMPHDAQGNVMDVMVNPLGVVTRQNPAQLVEAVLSKIAEKTGRPYKMPAFMPHGMSLIDYAIAEAKKHGVSDTEDLTDPATGRTLKGILTGKQFFMKLHFLAEKKKGARDTGGYTAEDMPARGGAEGAKKLGVWDINALLSHGATEVLKDAKTVRGQKNDEFWKAFQMGHTPPSPEVPLIYKKFMAHMIGSGINMKKSGSQLNLMAMTDKDVDQLSRGEVKEPKGVNADTMQEVPGGLFDKGLTGGHNGTSWTHIGLHEPMPNPIMEEPIRRMLGMTQKNFEDVMSGKERLHGRVGGEAIKEALARINLPELKRKTEETLQSGAKSRRSDAIKLLHYVGMMEKTGLRPKDFVLSKVPVLPPIFRPISATSKFIIKSDANSLYVDMMKHNQALKDVKDAFGHEQAGEERLNLYNSFKALTGLSDPINPKLKSQGVSGLLKQVFGPGSPKMGMFQYRVLGGTLDQAGLAVVTPNPSLDMDHIGLPEGHAWTLYKKFVVRKLVQRGMRPTDAIKAIADKSPQAMDVLHEEMGDRPMIMNRAPTLHKYNLMAFYPHLVKGHTLHVSPLVTAGFGMDFDGDTALMHIPVSDKAVDEAKKKMLPSRNLFAIRDFDVHYLPSQEYAYGLFLASSKKKPGEAKAYADVKAAIAAYKKGEIDADDRIRVRSTAH